MIRDSGTLTDFYGQLKAPYPEAVLFAVRTGGTVPESLRATYPRRELIAEIDRRRAGCPSVSYQVFRTRTVSRLPLPCAQTPMS